MFRFLLGLAFAAAACSASSHGDGSVDPGAMDMATTPPDDLSVARARDLAAAPADLAQTFQPGATVWIKQLTPSGFGQFGSPFGPSGGGTAGYAVALDSHGNLIVTGEEGSYNGSGYSPIPLIIKLDPDGNQLWQQMLTGLGVSTATSVAIDSNDNIYFLADSTLVKYSPWGTQTWLSDSYNSTGWSYTGDWWNTRAYLVLDPAGAPIVVEGVDSNRGQPTSVYATLVTKFDNSANVQWQHVYTSLGNPQAAAIDAAGNVLVAADYVYQTDGGAAEQQRVGVIDPSGNVTATWPLPNRAFAGALVADPNGGVFVGGSIEDIQDPYESRWFARLDPSGSLSWAQTLPPTSNAYTGRVQAIAFTADRKLVLAGESPKGSMGSSGVTWTAVADSSGTIQWERSEPPSGPDNEVANGVVGSGDGYVYVTGVIGGIPTILWVAKYAR